MMRSAGAAPILVTGAHRTGTTWVGRLLAAPPRVAYISEPLNVLHRLGVLNMHIPDWYTYICDDNASLFLSAFRELLSFRYNVGREIGSLRSLHDAGRMVRDLTTFVQARMRDSLPLIKDPFAVFSLAWFANELNCRVVVTVRHPAAFASGLKRLGWTFDFQNLLRQPLLMRDHLAAFRAAMSSQDCGDVVGQAGLLWSMIYSTLQRLRASAAGIQVVRHEDLAEHPVEGFRALYEALELEFTPQVERAILESSSIANPSELSSRRTHAVKMDSRASLRNWKRRLSVEEIARVRRLTQGVSELYYSEESWN